MATVSVQPKGKCWYTVISYKDENGKWRNKMQTTGLPIKGNKKRAEKVATERLAAFEEPVRADVEDPFLADYLKDWLNYMEGRVERTTYGGYASSVNCVLVPYFEPKKTRLKSFSLREAQTFYDELRKGWKSTEAYHDKALSCRFARGTGARCQNGDDSL